mgnify:CR=1 FL=1
MKKKKRKRFCFALDLKKDPLLINGYIEHHKKVWPEILKQIKGTGVESMEIYRISDRLFMIMETNFDFSLSKKQKKDASDPKVQEWETLMSKYQKVLPCAKPGEKWVLMDQIFKL